MESDDYPRPRAGAGTLLLDEVRCDCGALLFKASRPISPLEIKCRRCGRTFSTRPASPSSERQ